MLRIYAMYGRTPAMIVVCVCLAVCEALATAIIFALPRAGMIGMCLTIAICTNLTSFDVDTSNPASRVYICADGDPPGDHRTAYGWIPVIGTESILLCLSLYKGWQNRRYGYGGSTLLRVLTRDSVLYFTGCVDRHIARHR